MCNLVGEYHHCTRPLSSDWRRRRSIMRCLKGEFMLYIVLSNEISTQPYSISALEQIGKFVAAAFHRAHWLIKATLIPSYYTLK